MQESESLASVKIESEGNLEIAILSAGFALETKEQKQNNKQLI